jgi:hypothetical protein
MTISLTNRSSLLLLHDFTVAVDPPAPDQDEDDTGDGSAVHDRN